MNDQNPQALKNENERQSERNFTKQAKKQDT